MLLRKCGSPAVSLLGALLFAFAFGYSLWHSIPELGYAYYRWPDLSYSMRNAADLVAMVAIPAVIGYNAATLSAPRMYNHAAATRKPLSVQLLSIAAVVALMAVVALILGQLPLFVATVLQEKSFPLSLILELAQITLFLFSVGVIATLVGTILRRLHPGVAAIASMIPAYFLVAFTYDVKYWAVSPFLSVPNFSVFETANVWMSLAIGALLMVVITVFAALLLPNLERLPQAGYAAGGVLSVVAVIFGLIAAQGIVGKEKRTVADECATSTSGVEVCVHPADKEALPQALKDIDALYTYVPEAPPVDKLAEIQAAHLDSAGYQYVHIEGKARRVDLTNLVLATIKPENCADPTSESAKIIDQVGTFMVRDAGVYSRAVEEWGGFYMSVDEAGNYHGPAQLFKELPPEIIREFITTHWSDITACTATMEQINALA